MVRVYKTDNKRNNDWFKDQVDLLPFIDIDSNNLSTIHTTLMFIIDECDTREIEPVVNFDQPLWLKSIMIKTK